MSTKPTAGRGASDPPDIDVVIVNWNTGPHLNAAIASLEDARREGLGRLSVWVVDNCSTDASLDALEGRASSRRISVIRNQQNRGFAAASNQGAREGSGKFILFMNPDLRVDPDTLIRAVSFMESTPASRVGICGVRLVDQSGHAMPSCGRPPTLGIQALDVTGLPQLAPRWFKRQIMRPDELTEDRVVPHVTGAFFLIRRSLFDRLGGFDERFFMYYEEVDLALRAANAGWRSYHLAAVRACHIGELSSDQVRDRRLFYQLRSRTQFFKKHLSRRQTWVHVLVTSTVEHLARFAAALVGGRVRPSETLRGYRLYYRYLFSNGQAGGRHSAERPAQLERDSRPEPARRA